MSAVKEETAVTTTIDVDAMIEQQTEEMQKFFETVKNNDRLNVLRPRWPIKDYLKRVIDRHIDLMEAFGGWRWHSTPFENMPMPDSQIQTIIETASREWQRGAILYANEKGKTPEKMAPVPIMNWESEADAVFCSVFGCHLPYPKSTSYDLWRARMYSGRGEKERIEEYAARTSFKIRDGQAVSRAILTEVRKVYKDHPNYVKMWESIAEKMGVGWAASKGNPVTLSFAPVDFLRCGHYGEANSCYRTGGQQEHSKYNLSMIVNSVMGIFYDVSAKDHKSSLLLRKEKPVARCWGILDMENQGGLFSNLYLLQWPQVTSSLEAALKQAFNWDVKGGLPTEGATQNFYKYAYTNGDNNIFGVKATLALVQKGVNEQSKMMDAIQHTKTPCGSCATPFGHPDMLIRCGCGQFVCENCTTKTECCETVKCKRCPIKVVNCAGCKKVTCGKCAGPEGELGMCRDTGAQYCTTCAASKLSKCAYCTSMTSKPSVCSIDGGQVACQLCAKDKHRECSRCDKVVSLKYITRCSGCKKRRCNNCTQEGETTEPRSLCASCQENGVQPKEEPKIDAEVLLKFKRGLEALDVEKKNAIIKIMREFKWDADDLVI